MTCRASATTDNFDDSEDPDAAPDNATPTGASSAHTGRRLYNKPPLRSVVSAYFLIKPLLSVPFPKPAATIIAQANFLLSAAELHQLPPPGAPEVCFLGRSNAGKSSALNVIAGQRKLAFVSKTPGRTRLINFFDVPRPYTVPAETLGILVDLPGYGYAAVAKYEQQDWDRILGGYLRLRTSLVGAVLLVDIRRGVTDMDLACLKWIAPLGIRLCVLVTKADKLAAGAQRAALRTILSVARQWVPHAEAILFSTPKRWGVEAAQQWVLSCFDPAEASSTSDSGSDGSA